MMGTRSKSWLVWILAVVVVALLRHITVLADFYVLNIYPAVSWVLSLASCAVPFSLEEIAVLAFAVLLIAFIVKKRFLSILKLAAVIYMWFYLGWGICYSRTGLLERAGVQRAQFDEQQFKDFLYDYSNALDSLYQASLEPSDFDVVAGMKKFYSQVPRRYGLAKPRKWQHAKKPLLNWLYSGSGVSGFMGPFFAESQLNRDLPDEDYPFTLMHEYSHLLGTAVESEANWWAFQACNAQPDAGVRFCGYYSILPYVWSNARGLLDDEDFQAWSATVLPEIIELNRENYEFWQSKRFEPLDKAQNFIYNIFLKGNGVAGGTQNYSQVVGLLMALPVVSD